MGSSSPRDPLISYSGNTRLELHPDGSSHVLIINKDAKVILTERELFRSVSGWRHGNAHERALARMVPEYIGEDQWAIMVLATL